MSSSLWASPKNEFLGLCSVWKWWTILLISMARWWVLLYLREALDKVILFHLTSSFYVQKSYQLSSTRLKAEEISMELKSAKCSYHPAPSFCR
jgi:hypothetical protein